MKCCDDDNDNGDSKENDEGSRFQVCFYPYVLFFIVY